MATTYTIQISENVSRRWYVSSGYGDEWYAECQERIGDGKWKNLDVPEQDTWATYYTALVDLRERVAADELLYGVKAVVEERVLVLRG